MAGLLLGGAPGHPARAGQAPLERTSRGQAGAGPGGGGEPAVSADGRFVAFVSTAADLVPGQLDANEATDVFLHDRQTGTTTLVSRTPGSAATAGNGESLRPSLSADGRFVAFVSAATDLMLGQVDVNGNYDVFLHDRVDQVTTLLSRASGSAATTGDGYSADPVVSADGQFVAFTSLAQDLLAGQVDGPGTPDVFLHDRVAQTLALVSRTATSALTTGDHGSGQPAISADGRFVAFVSEALGLVAGHVDPNGLGDVFLYDRLARTTRLVSHVPGQAAKAGSDESSSPAISADGRLVAFTSHATDLVPGLLDGNGGRDVFLHDALTGTTVLVSRTAASAVVTGDGESIAPAVSDDGRFVAFASAARNLVSGQADADSELDVFLYDRELETTTLVSRTAASAVTGGGGVLAPPVISGAGDLVAFTSTAPDLVADQADGNGDLDVFLHDRAAGTTRLLSRPRPGPTGATRALPGAVVAGNGPSYGPALAAGGTVVAFTSLASNLAGDDANGGEDVFAWPRPCPDRPEPRPCLIPASR